MLLRRVERIVRKLPGREPCEFQNSGHIAGTQPRVVTVKSQVVYWGDDPKKRRSDTVWFSRVGIRKGFIKTEPRFAKGPNVREQKLSRQPLAPMFAFLPHRS